MAFKYFDRVKETSTTTGTGQITLAGAVSGFVSFTSVYSNNDTMYYTITDQSGSNWEVGLGTFVSSGTKLTRTTVLASSNSGSAVNFTSGALYVFTTIASAQLTGVSSGGVVGRLLNVQVLTGTTTYTPSAGTNTIAATGVGGGGGGGGANSSTGGTGGTTSLGSLLSAAGGTGGNDGNSASTCTPGAGGTPTVGNVLLVGSSGNPGIAIANAPGGNGAPGLYGSGAGSAGNASVATGSAGIGNTGAGGGGGKATAVINSGAGGGAGGIAIYYGAVSGNQTATIGAGGTAGAAGSGNAGGAGGTGIIIVEEYS